MFANNSIPMTMNVVPTGTANGGFMDGFGNGNSGWWLILLILLFGWGGRGYGGFGYDGGGQINENYTLTNDMSMLSRQLSDGFNNQERRTDAIINGISSGFYENAQLTNNLDKSIANGNYAIQNGLTNVQIAAMQNQNALQTQISQCCCDEKTILAQMGTDAAMRSNATDTLIGNQFSNLNYNLATQMCDTRRTIVDSDRNLTDVQNANTREILAAIQSIKTDALQDKIATLQAENQTLKFAASQQAQNAYITASQADQTQYILDKLSPCPKPAILYSAPQPITNIGCGCNCGC